MRSAALAHTALKFVLALVCLGALAHCGDLEGTSGQTSGGGPPTACPDLQDAYAQANGLPLPYPANPMNPTAYSPNLPPPIVYHPCLNPAGAQAYYAAVPCYVCNDALDRFAVLLNNVACSDTTERSPSPPTDPSGNVIGEVVCVAPIATGSSSCDSAGNGCF